MCSHYLAEAARKKLQRLGVDVPDRPPGALHVYPTQRAPIIRQPVEAGAGRELLWAHFGLLPTFAQELKYGVRTYNARSETVAALPSFRDAWAGAQHCIVPCEAIYEPDWRSGRCVPTRISRADGQTLAVAGLWAAWRGPQGQRLDSFTMLTINADTHPLFNTLHKPDPQLAADRQDKRMVVILDEADQQAWLTAPARESERFLQPLPASRLVAVGEGAPAEPDLFSDLFSPA